MAHLLIVTNSFPYSGYTEGCFIKPELYALCDAFECVTVIPDHVEEKHLNRFDGNAKYLLEYEYMLNSKGGGILAYFLC